MSKKVTPAKLVKSAPVDDNKWFSLVNLSESDVRKESQKILDANKLFFFTPEDSYFLGTEEVNELEDWGKEGAYYSFKNDEGVYIIVPSKHTKVDKEKVLEEAIEALEVSQKTLKKYADTIAMLNCISSAAERITLLTYWKRGEIGNELLNAGGPPIYGAQAAVRIASDMGISESALRQSIMFYKVYDKARVEYLAENKFSWRNALRLSYLPDTDKRKELEEKVISGEATYADIDDELKSIKDAENKAKKEEKKKEKEEEEGVTLERADDAPSGGAAFKTVVDSTKAVSQGMRQKLQEFTSSLADIIANEDYGKARSAKAKLRDLFEELTELRRHTDEVLLSRDEIISNLDNNS